MILDKIVARELSTATSQTRPSPSAPDRRNASVQCSVSTAFGRGSGVMPASLMESAIVHRPVCESNCRDIESSGIVAQ